MSTIDFRPWMSLTQRLKARRAAERGDTRHAHERAIAGDLDRAAAQHSPAASTAPAPAFPAKNRAEAVSADDVCLTWKETRRLLAYLRDRNHPDRAALTGAPVSDLLTTAPLRPGSARWTWYPSAVAVAHGERPLPARKVPHVFAEDGTPTADVAERYVQWEADRW